MILPTLKDFFLKKMYTYNSTKWCNVEWCQVSVMTLESLSIHNLFPRMIHQTTIQETFLVQEDEYIFTNMLNSF